MTDCADIQRQIDKAITWLELHGPLGDEKASEYQRRYNVLYSQAERDCGHVAMRLPALEFGPGARLRVARR